MWRRPVHIRAAVAIVRHGASGARPAPGATGAVLIARRHDTRPAMAFHTVRPAAQETSLLNRPDVVDIIAEMSRSPVTTLICLSVLLVCPALCLGAVGDSVCCADPASDCVPERECPVEACVCCTTPPPSVDLVTLPTFGTPTAIVIESPQTDVTRISANPVCDDRLLRLGSSETGGAFPLLI